MAVGLKTLPALEPVEGIRLGTARAGIRYRDRADLGIAELAPGSRCAAVFTRNAFVAAPVVVARRHLARAAPRYLLVNTGNANAGTGDAGITDAERCCGLLAERAGCAAEEVLPFSTGVIGEPLPTAPFAPGIDAALAALEPGGWAEFARAIMTTDTVPKGASASAEWGGGRCVVTGVAKGAGMIRPDMIRPDMATMLAFVGTDAAVDAPVLQACLARAVAASFHRITVDGDTSTNDACVLMATGRGSAPAITEPDGPAARALERAVRAVCVQLAQALVRDAEGATRFITVEVGEGADEAECLRVAYTVAESPLVKTACFAGDPNWGRILAAVGRAGLADLAVEGVRVWLDDVCVAEGGARATGYREADGRRVMGQEEFTIRVSLGRGAHSARVWTSDLSHDYVRINAEYRS